MITKLGILCDQFPGIMVSVSLSDLKDWSESIIGETKKQLEQVITDENTETYHSPEKVAELLEVSKQTLWRWAKAGYLVPIEIGGKRRYRMSDVKRILEGPSANKRK